MASFAISMAFKEKCTGFTRFFIENTATLFFSVGKSLDTAVVLETAVLKV